MEPVIKVRHKIITFMVLICFDFVFAGISKCDKRPTDQSADKTPGDEGFAVHLNGSPRLYRPRQNYTITLNGFRDDIYPIKFIDFMLVAEPSQGSTITDSESLGTMELKRNEAMVQFSQKCSHAIEASSSRSKETVTVFWTAPPRGSGCIDFKAMVVERPDVWYMDDGALTYSVCEDESTIAEPMEVEPCCACDEAKYEVIFEGIWSRHTHPKDFPEDEWRTQFSTLIGASHSANYSLWDYGEIATLPMRYFGEKALTRPLEAEMKKFSPSIRSVIKAHGLQQRSNVAGQTFAVFRADRRRHLLSLVSKMIPSPDFIVGVSKENLCLRNCSWVPSRTIDLYPWDIGTDRGVRYDSPPDPQRPIVPIQRITSSSPPDPNSPFFDPSSAPMKPAARLHIIRQRLYKKHNCPNLNGMNGNPMNPSWHAGIYPTPQQPHHMGGGSGLGNQHQSSVDYTSDSHIIYGDGIGSNSPTDDYTGGISGGNNGYYAGGNRGGSSSSYDNYDTSSNQDSCSITEWTEWTLCSQTCGFGGSRERTRKYISDIEASTAGCGYNLWEKKKCERLPECPPKHYQGNFDLFESQDQVKNWNYGEYSRKDERRRYDGVGRGAMNNFNVPASYGYQSLAPRRNSYEYSSNHQASYVYPSYPQPERLHQDDSNTVDVVQNCAVSEWGEWSDCSSKCATGIQTRQRYYEEIQSSTGCSEILNDHQSCAGYDPSCPSKKTTTTHRPNSYLNNRKRKPQMTHSENNMNRRPPSTPGICDVSPWSEWSPCSKKCDNGYKMRTRLYLIPFVPDRKCDIQLIDRENCYGTDCGGNFLSDDSNLDEIIYADTTVNSINDDTTGGYIIKHESEPEDICQMNMDPGSGRCLRRIQRWYYNQEDNSCQQFHYSGCGGNKNNFASKQECFETCRTRSTKDWKTSKADPIRELQAMSLIRLPDPVSSTPPHPETDCQVTSWTSWSSCSEKCGKHGWQTRHREVMIPASNGGRGCPKKLVRRRKCRDAPCFDVTNHEDWYQGSWRRLIGA